MEVGVRHGLRVLENRSLIMAAGLGHYGETLLSLEQPGIAMELIFELQSLPTPLHPLLLAQTLSSVQGCKDSRRMLPSVARVF